MKRIMPLTARGPLTATIDELSSWMTGQGYARTMVPQVLGVARGLSAWMDDHNLTTTDLTPSVLNDFQTHYGPTTPGHTIVTVRIPVLRRFFIESRLLTDADAPRKRPRPPDGKQSPPLHNATEGQLAAWADWQRRTRNISDGCIRYRRMWATELVDSLTHTSTEIDWSSCTPTLLNTYVGQRCAGYAPASRTAIIDSIRSLMRWALATGRIDRDLAPAILQARTSRATLPRGLSTDQVQTLLTACNQHTVIGIRDAAVIRLLWRLGLRAGECAGLQLDGLNWATGSLTVVGKGHRRLTLPIPHDVGDSLIAWLRVRPSDATDRAVFVRARTPINGLTGAGISDIVKHRADNAGLGLVHAHRLRHTAAMHVIATGGSLTEAQELLGHQNAAITSVYARVDLNSLRDLTIPFGRVPE